MGRRGLAILATLAALVATSACSGTAKHAKATAAGSGAPVVPVLSGGASTPVPPTANGPSSATGVRPPLTSSVPLQQSTGWSYGKPASLPVDEPTGIARQVITVTATSTRSETAMLQAWQRGNNRLGCRTGRRCWPTSVAVGSPGMSPRH